MSFEEFEELLHRLVEEELQKELAQHGKTNTMSAFLVAERVVKCYKQYCEELGRPTPQAVGYIGGFIRGYSYAICRAAGLLLPTGKEGVAS